MEHEIAARWVDYRRRKRVFWIVFLLYLPAMISFGLFVVQPLGWDERWLAGAACGWMMAWAASGTWLSRLTCPECGAGFFRSTRAGMWHTANVWARRCRHCSAISPAQSSSRDTV